MDDLFSHIARWLGESHTSWRGRTSYNVEIVLAIAMSIGGAIIAKDYAAQRKASRERTLLALSSSELVATSFSGQDGQRVKYRGTLRQENKAYTVSILRQSDLECTETHGQPLPSLEAIEAYLTSQTVFVLADFKEPPASHPPAG